MRAHLVFFVLVFLGLLQMTTAFDFFQFFDDENEGGHQQRSQGDDDDDGPPLKSNDNPGTAGL